MMTWPALCENVPYGQEMRNLLLCVSDSDDVGSAANIFRPGDFPSVQRDGRCNYPSVDGLYQQQGRKGHERGVSRSNAPPEERFTQFATRPIKVRSLSDFGWAKSSAGGPFSTITPPSKNAT